VDETRRLIRDSNGQQVVSESTLVVHPVMENQVNPMDVFAEGSEVSINGRPSEVLSARELKVRGQVFAVEVNCR
jgi:DNA/RNA endonuclease YhcR with UshA esterase domain